MHCKIFVSSVSSVKSVRRDRINDSCRLLRSVAKPSQHTPWVTTYNQLSSSVFVSRHRSFRISGAVLQPFRCVMSLCVCMCVIIGRRVAASVSACQSLEHISTSLFTTNGMEDLFATTTSVTKSVDWPSDVTPTLSKDDVTSVHMIPCISSPSSKQVLARPAVAEKRYASLHLRT